MERVLASNEMNSSSNTHRVTLLLAENELDISTLEAEAFPAGGAQLEASRTWTLKRRIEFMMGRIVARRSLTQAGGPGAQATLESLEDRRCKWPSAWSGSITHSWDRGQCLSIARVTRSRSDQIGPGVDVESWEKLAGSSKGASERVLLDEDRLLVRSEALVEWARQVGKPAELALFAWTFSAKEAFYKALYDSALKYFGFDAARMVEPKYVGATLECGIETTVALAPSIPVGFRLAARTWVERERWVATEIVLP
jgi:4'-phosphopantetheinyl transferase EntD